MTRSRATLTGFAAVLSWSLLALLTVWSAPVPPFQLTALCFGAGAGASLLWIAARGRLHLLRDVPLSAHLFATAGLFAYHLTYFSALHLAPPAEAGLIAYLWPLLIVLLAGLLPGERLSARHLGGAVLAFGGVALLTLGPGAAPDAGALPGYALALLCAVVWAGYSVGSRRFREVPSEAVAVPCLATALLSGLAHLALEETAWPLGARGWGAVLLLGLGPLGVAFLAWDVGMKRGDIQLLGVASYAAPLMSTLALVGAGEAAATPALGIAALLIVAGAALAARGPRRA